MRFVGALAVALALCGCATTPVAGPSGLSVAEQWTIGPIVDGKVWSVGAASHPAQEADGWGFDIPADSFPPSNHADYVSEVYGPLTGKTAIHIRFRLTVPAGSAVLARSQEGAPGMLTPYFQREGDDWSAGVDSDPKFEAYRWYAPSYQVYPLVDGTYEIVAPLTGKWSAILTSTSENNPAAFADAIAHAQRVGFVLGGGDSLGHGDYTGCSPQPCQPQPAHLTILSFSVE